MPKSDPLEIEIDPETGLIKIATGKIAPADHKLADEMMAYIARMTGGEVKRVKRGLGHVHVGQKVEQK